MTERMHLQDGCAPARVVDRVAKRHDAWRPETASVEERGRARALGEVVRSARINSGLTQRALARTAGVGERHLQRLERGKRLTRASTLLRLAQVIEPDDKAAALLLERMLVAAGATLADESEHAERVERRRIRRVAAIERNQHQLISTARLEVVGGGTVERRVVDLPDDRTGRRMSVRYVLVRDDGCVVPINPSLEILKEFAVFPVRWSKPEG